MHVIPTPGRAVAWKSKIRRSQSMHLKDNHKFRRL